MARNKFDQDEILESPFQWKHLKRAFQYIRRHRTQMPVSYTHLTLPTILLV